MQKDGNKIIVELAHDKRIIIAYTSGQYPNLTQTYYAINYNLEPELLSGDLDNLLDDFLRKNPEIELVDEVEATTEEEIKSAIDYLLEKLNKIKQHGR